MANIKKENIRNFCIIAHIDHGKSTLADRIIEMTGALSEREMESQVLDNMDIEKERGITIKSQAVRMEYTAKNGETYIFNLIDTPGHVDFNYEVSRSLAACEGAILVVDSTQGVEAQTLANVYLAIDNDLEILPVINKVDLPNARPDDVKKEIEDIIGIPAEDAPCISAKSGLNVEEVLERIVTDFPAPKQVDDDKLSALIFDSFYDNYKGALSYVRIKSGEVKEGDEILFMATGKTFTVSEVGYFGAGIYKKADKLISGEVGYIAASIKNVSDLNDAIFKYTDEFEESKGMGTTLVLCIITKEYILFGNVGDSSGYVMKNNTLFKVTKDHTLVNLLVETGELSEEEAKNHPRKNVLMRALGANNPIDVDIFDLVDSDYSSILLCSDGLTNMLSDAQLERVLNSDYTMEQ